MKSVSKRRKARHGSKKAGGAPNYYREMYRPSGEEHPIDFAVARRVRGKRTLERLARLQRKVMGRIEGDKKPFLALEQLRSEMSADREEACFNLGYEHGLTDALARSRRGSTPLSKEAKQLATETRERMVRLNVAPWQAVLCLLECLWGLAATHGSAAR